MTNNEKFTKEEFEDLKEYISETVNKAKNSKDKEFVAANLENIKKMKSKVIVEIQNLDEKDTVALKQLDAIYQELAVATEELKETIDTLVVAKKDTKKGFTLGFVGSWFKNRAKQQKELDELEEELEADEKENKRIEKSTRIKKVAIAGTAIGLAAVISLTSFAINKHKASKEKQQAELDALNNQQTIEQVVEEQTEEETQEEVSKEEKILELVNELTEELNSHEGINVAQEDVLALFIHLNVGNSYMNEEDTLALDKVTRETLIKKYFVGLTEGTEEFDSYTITDDDLSKLAADVFNIRNSLVNRVIVLNDEGNYEESRELISIIGKFVTESKLQDETQVLIDSVCAMQTNDSKQQKEEIYRYYNYIFAGPKSSVRNFDDYGHYTDIDNNEMTYENQGTTIRFLTWFLDTFVDINLNQNIIPQDIINSKTAKLMDQATLMRMLGFKNCSSFNAYYGIDFDEAIDNKSNTGKSSSKSKSSSSKTESSSSSSSTISHATGDEQIDAQIDSFLELNPNVGSSFQLNDGSTMTITESGPSSTTVVIEPDPSSAVITDTTPSGPSERTETEGGGNERVEEIQFEEDSSTEIIQEGGEVIQSEISSYSIESEDEPIVTSEEIQFEEDTTESYTEARAEINRLLLLKQAILGNQLSIDSESDKSYQKGLSC
jgi:hypothetical protein